MLKTRKKRRDLGLRSVKNGSCNSTYTLDFFIICSLGKYFCFIWKVARKWSFIVQLQKSRHFRKENYCFAYVLSKLEICFPHLNLNLLITLGLLHHLKNFKLLFVMISTFNCLLQGPQSSWYFKLYSSQW